MSVEGEYKTVALISFESEFAPSGGLAAVMRYLPREMIRVRQTILIAPFFPRIKKSREAYSRGDISFSGLKTSVRYGNRDYLVRILEYREKINQRLYKIYFVESEHFFLATTDPYVNPGKEELLFEDALFFSAAIPRVLRVIPEEAPFILHLQDWETACVAEVIPETIPHKCVLTLHNPYDHVLTEETLRRIADPASIGTGTTTVLLRTLPKMAGVSTVSRNFAGELTSDPLHTSIFAPHLQDILTHKGIIGIENGNFAASRLSFPSDPAEVLTVKKSAREELLKLLEGVAGKEMLEKCWGTCELSDISIPLILMFGRDDPRQKGFDVAAETARQVLKEEGKGFARFIFTPIPGQNGIGGLKFLKKLAEEFNGSVMVFPFRMQVGYMELQFSASYLLMTSLYEPFGGATEGYANGVPVIARATGGLVQQVYPKNYRELPESTQLLVEEYHGMDKRPTGFLFREKGLTNPVNDWQGIIRAKYLDEIPPGDPIAERIEFSLFKAMVEAAAGAVKSAVRLYKKDYREYAELVANGLEMMKRFSWHQATIRYVTELYRL